MDNKFQKKGYAFESMSKIVRYCHSKLNINEIYLWVQFKNLDAIKLYKKLGFLVSKPKRNYLHVKPKPYVKEVFMVKIKNLR